MSAAKIVTSVVSTMMDTEPKPLPDWDEGPDDLWPDEGDEPVPDDSGELVTTLQYGLRTPGGEVHWGSWSGISFDEPIDRVRMIAKLQQAAKECEWQIDEFVNRYTWVARYQRAIVRYEDAGEFAINAPEVIAIPTVEQAGEQ